jgi:DNA repair protein RadC
MRVTEQLVNYGLTQKPSGFKKVKIKSSIGSSNFIKGFYSNDLVIYESFFLILLNQANETIGYVKISQGGISSTVVDNRIIANYAIQSLASAVIIAHNHPSGNREPSRADKHLTSKLITALELFDISVLDHIILTSESYYSFADEGILK